MSEIDANILVEGQKAVATVPLEGDIVQDSGAIDATCIVQDSGGNKHKAIKVINIENEPVSSSETDAQILTDNNELVMITAGQEGEIIPQNNSEIDFHCLVQNENDKQLAVKTIELEGDIIKTGGAIDTSCLVQDSGGNQQLAIKVFNKGGSSVGWKGKPADWSDIRKDCPKNSIALYAAHATDFTSYDNLGFSATCTGGYNVFIDGVQYGSTYASNAQCSITWSTSGITTGDDITTPSTLKAHKIWIEPATEGNNITRFRCYRVAASGNEEQGILWAHFNLSNNINLASLFYDDTKCRNKLVLACTAKGNTINLSTSIAYAFYMCNALEYLPVLIGSNINMSLAFPYVYALENLTFKGNGTTINNTFYNATALKQIKGNPTFAAGQGLFYNCYALEELPDINFSSATNCNNLIVNASSLKDTVLDASAGTGITKIGCYGNSTYFMTGFKGLRVSNQAPFSNATPPQINVSYTGMDRTALVQLFNDLPTVSSGQIINITGCTGASSLTDDEVSIATNKGWTVTGGPAFQAFATFSGAQIGDTVKLNDGMATSDKNWSAYPSDTAITGDYTQTATVTAVSGDTIECAKPTQDDKTITITTDEDTEIEVVDNTSFNTVTINADQTADIETSANVTTDNNVVLTGGSYHTFKMTVPSSMTHEIQIGGAQYTVDTLPALMKKDTTITLLLKDGNNVYYRNMWKLIKDLRLNYQQINFTYPTGATVTCKVNNVTQSNLTPYCYAGDTVTWTCDNAGTVTTGTYTVKYNELSGNIQTITIS